MTLFEEKPKKKRSIKRIVAWSIAGLICLPALIFSSLPSPYLIERPGPAYDVLSTAPGTKIFNISGTKTYPTQGKLDLLTIVFNGTAYAGVSWLQVALSHLDPSVSLIPKDLVYPPDKDTSQIDQEGEVMMIDSQASAKAAALNLLGIPFESPVKVTAVIKNSAAEGKLKAGDTLITVNGEKTTGLEQIRKIVTESQDKKAVVFLIERAGVQKTVEITPRKDKDKYLLGIFVDNIPELPFKIDIKLDQVSGPSGGQIFALAIYDLLTPGSLLGNNHVAGTGTVDPAGNVGAIGGIKQKMYGAKDAGAQYFLAPADNCDEVVGNIPDGIKVFKVATLKDSLKALEAIKAGNVAGLSVCTTK
ncbi:MAG: hypothetical protein RIQ88_42 [Actinomycetota bacterium]|jgi:Lon-like protease